MGPGTSAAQEAPIAQTFDDLQAIVHRDDSLTVTDDQGHEVRGRLFELSSAALVLQVDGKRIELARDAVYTVTKRRGDSLKNGTMTGLVVGVLSGVVTGLVWGGIGVDPGEEVPFGAIALTAGVAGGIGAGIGAGLDALVQKHHVIYQRPPAGRASLRLSAVVTPDRRGVSVTWGF
jgi:hypothetical protein